MCYAIRYCSQGARTCSGDSGYPSVRGACGTIFRFYPCDLSFNGTTPQRGQIPNLIYYSVPLNYQGNKLKNNKEVFARDIALEIASDIVYRSKELLILARNAFIYSLSSSSDKSSSNSSNTTQAFDSEHNITPIEEHFDVNWMTPTVTPSLNAGPSTAYYSKDPKDSNINTTTKDLTKRIETFSRGIIETLKFDKKPDKNSFDLGEVDVAAKEITPSDYLIEEAKAKLSTRALSSDVQASHINGNTKTVLIGNQLSKSESDESLQNGAEREKINELFTIQETSLFHTLLPLTVAHLSRLICSDPKVSVETLNLTKCILPHISSWNQICNKTPVNSEFGEFETLKQFFLSKHYEQS